MYSISMPRQTTALILPCGGPVRIDSPLSLGSVPGRPSFTAIDYGGPDSDYSGKVVMERVGGRLTVVGTENHTTKV